MSEQVHETDDETDVTTDQTDDERVDTDHLDGMDDGCGCAEVWEHLSENRDEASADD